MVNKNTQLTITRKELTEMSEVDIRSIDRDKLVEIKTVNVKTELPDKERMADFIEQIGNPYCYLCNGMVIKTRFAGKQSLEDCLKATMFAEKDN